MTDDGGIDACRHGNLPSKCLDCLHTRIAELRMQVADLKFVATALLPWCGEFELEARAAKKVLGNYTPPSKDFETALQEIIDSHA